MYTKLDDLKMAHKIHIYMVNHPNATRQSISRNCLTTIKRMKQLEKEGYIKLPEAMPRELRNREYYANKAVQSESP